MSDKINYKCSFTLPSIDGVNAALAVSLCSEFDSDPLSFPILKTINNIGAAVGELVPTEQRGQIIIDNSYQLLGQHRRFSDILERYSVVNQNILIYKSLTSYSAAVDYELLWQGKIASCSLSNTQGTVTLNISRNGIANTILTQEVTKENYPSCPDSSVGRIIPLVIGYNQQVQPTLVSESTNSLPDWNIGKFDAEFAYGTNFANEFQNVGVNKIFIRGNDNLYRNVRSAIDIGLAIGDSGATGNTIASQFLAPNAATEEGDTFAGRTWVAKQTGWPFRLADYGCAIVAVEQKLFIYNTGTYSISLTAWNDNKGFPGNQIASVTKTNAQSTSLGTFYDYYTSTNKTLVSMQFVFDQPIVVAPGEQIYFTYSITDDTGSTPAQLARAYDKGETFQRVDLVDDALKKQVWKYSTTDKMPDAMAIYGLDFVDKNKGAGDYLGSTDGPVDADGFGSSKLLVCYGTDDNNFNWNDLGIIIEVTGLAASGATTPKYKAKDVCELLFRKWNGSTWAADSFNADAFEDSHGGITTDSNYYYRTLSTNFPQRTTLKQIAEVIARNTFTKFVPVLGATNNIGLYAYGSELDTSFDFTDDDISIEAIDWLGTESIINRAKVLYAPIKLASNKAYLNSTYSNSFDTASEVNNAATLSKSQYGLCELADNAFDGIYPSGFSARALARMFILRYSQPSAYVTFLIPFKKASDLQLMTVGTIQSPQLPAFFGTAGFVKFPACADDFTPSIPVVNDYLKRAQRYRIQIEGFNLILDMQELMVRIKARILYGADIT